jgi:hypothetical protein
MISQVLKDKNRKLFLANRDANQQLMKIEKCEKNMKLLQDQLKGEIAKLVSILSNIK